ncbi:MAG: mechanosensitive ion channel family protein [Enterococcus sp.]
MNYLLAAAQSTTDSSTSSITEPAAEQLNAIQRWWHSLDWEAIIGVMIQKALFLIMLTILFIVLFKVGDFVVNRSYETYMKKNNLNENRVHTLHTLIHNIVHYTLGFFLVYALLSVLGVPVGSLLAGAGIAGLAVGLGAQGFMNDIITGFFIIMEQQIDVGDYINLGALGIEGTVTSVGLRTLQLKSTDGTVHFVPNRNITTISNTSRANMQVIVEVRILPSEDQTKIRQIIEATNQRLAQKHQQDIQVPPSIFGLVDLGNGNFAIRTTMYVLNGKQFNIKQEFLAASVDALTEAGFTIPQNPIITGQ